MTHYVRSPIAPLRQAWYGGGMAEEEPGYVFPAVRGVQAGREYYVTMCPLRLLTKIFVFDGDELLPEQRAQRQLNKGRVPALARYLTDNPDSYVFSAITASIDGDLRFVPTDEGCAGTLHVPLNATFVVNDGQHRRAAIEVALREVRRLADETIAVVFFHDRGLSRCQQMFADLNRHAIRPSPSLNVLYDHRDERANLARLIIDRLPEYRALVDLERASLSAGSQKLFTLSAMHRATRQLVSGLDRHQGHATAVVGFWEAMHEILPEWGAVGRGSLSAGAVRSAYVHPHGVMLHALGRVGNAFLHEGVDDWSEALAGLSSVNWGRFAPTWQRRAVIGGNLTNSSRSVVLTGNALKKHLGLKLSAEEMRHENSMKERA